MALTSYERISISAEWRRLANGRYKDVVVRSTGGRFSADDFEMDCINERDCKEDAITGAKKLAPS
jgi:hypothetical protein